VNDRLITIFLAEANELIVDLERALLLLEKDFSDQSGISSIFRSMHTLKGAAGMFGFDSVNGLTHHLESIYQDIRDGKRGMTAAILTITFKTLDHLREVLQSGEDHTDHIRHHELLAEIKQLEASASNEFTAVNQKRAHQSPIGVTYYIRLVPTPTVLQNGTNPLFLVDDLLALGKGTSLPYFKDLPNLDNLVPDICHVCFEVILFTDKSEEDVRGVFIFAENQCDITIQKIGEDDYVKKLTSMEHPWQHRSLTGPVGFETICVNLGAIDVKQIQTPSNPKQNNSTKSSSIRVQTEQLDDLMNLVSELVTTQAQLTTFSGKDSSTELSAISENIEKITRRLRDNAFTMSLVPMETLVVRFQRLVSDLSKDLNKDIQFKADGMDTKIDKSIIEKLTDPLLHLLRNCIDHGIESPEIRADKGKSPGGCLQLKSYYSGANVIIEITDDGAGINLNLIREKAISKGLIENQVNLSDKELIDLIFIPGFSTASKITGVSGRGVGMDVVKRNISDIRGEIEVTSQVNKGTTFTIKLPLTLSIVDGLLVKVGDTSFLLPLTAVTKCYEVETANLESAFNHWITLEGERTPFLFLRSNFMITEKKPRLSQIIKVPYQESYVGIAVDKIEGEYQAVLKPLGQLYHGQDEFSGATILGDGSVALVFDPGKLIKNLNEANHINN
jgi:two-component system chemotaxis sensor kinase CheA